MLFWIILYLFGGFLATTIFFAFVSPDFEVESTDQVSLTLIFVLALLFGIAWPFLLLIYVFFLLLKHLSKYFAMWIMFVRKIFKKE